MKVSTLKIISLLLVLQTYCNESVLGLYEITEDAIRVGRELKNLLNYAEPGKTNITAAGILAVEYLEKFNEKHNADKPIPDIDFNGLALKDSSSSTDLMDGLSKLKDFQIKSLPKILMSMVRNKNENLFVPSSEYLNESSIGTMEDNEDRPFITKLSNLHKNDYRIWNIVGTVIQRMSGLHCRLVSIQTLLYLLDYITMSDAMGYVILQFYYTAYKIYRNEIDAAIKPDQLNVENLEEIESTWMEKDVDIKMKDLEIEFFNRNAVTLQFFKETIAALKRESWHCYDESWWQIPPPVISAEKDTTKLNNLFQAYIINEVDLNKYGSCTETCADYRRTSQYDCSNEEICRQRSCDGTLWDCNELADSEKKFCPPRRFDPIVRYDKAHNCRESFQVSLANWRRGFVKCTYCRCTCEEKNIAGDRYFNLRPVASDVNANYVIVNVKFTKVNHVVHIQIQEAELLPEGRMNITSARWKPVDNYTVCSESVKDTEDYHTISYKQRTILIDEITAPKKYALTALKFSSENGNLRLKIQATRFNFITGKLDKEDCRWFSNDNTEFSNRHEEKFKNINDVNTTPNRYIRFTPNNMNIDMGQTTIPYIENQEVIQLFQPTILSGVGLITKNLKNVGSSLGFKVISYDYASHLPIENDKFIQKYISYPLPYLKNIINVKV